MIYRHTLRSVETHVSTWFLNISSGHLYPERSHTFNPLEIRGLSENELPPNPRVIKMSFWSYPPLPWPGSGDDGRGCAATATVAGDSLAAWPRLVLALPVLQWWKARVPVVKHRRKRWWVGGDGWDMKKGQYVGNIWKLMWLHNVNKK